MCWIGKNNPQIAKEDIKVFKVVRKPKSDKNVYTSFYFNFHYKVGETYTSDTIHPTPTEDGENVQIYHGFHSYNSKTCNIMELGSLNWVGIEIKYNNLIILDVLSDKKLFMLHCRIPKGATYYENDMGEIASDKLFIDSVEAI